MTNGKSDVRAKQAYVARLKEMGFENPAVCSTPADICSEKDGKKWYFEIKMTKRRDTYFGAATLTEWIQAVSDPEHFRFVIAQTTDNEETFSFTEYTPAEFMEFSSIPPFKIFFNINLEKQDSKGWNERKTKKKGKAIRLTSENIKLMSELFRTLKN